MYLVTTLSVDYRKNKILQNADSKSLNLDVIIYYKVNNLVAYYIFNWVLNKKLNLNM